MPTPTLVVPPAKDVLTVAELKAPLRIQFDAEDELIETYIKTATEVCQVQSRRQFITATYRYDVQSPDASLRLPWSPFQSIVSVVNGDDEPVDYDLDDTGLRAVVTLTTVPDRIAVTYTVGYGDEPEEVPQAARHAVRLLASHYWRVRDNSDEIPAAIAALLDTIRIREVA